MRRVAPAPDGAVPDGIRPEAVLLLLARHPWALLVRRWNYKAALTSAVCRAALFFVSNLSAGADAATAAMATEFVYRALTSGFYGAITQALGRASPPRAAWLTAMVLLPLLGHGAELAIHWWRETPRLGASLALSVSFTCLTTTFNLFAMRRGVLVVGVGAASLADDLRALPGVLRAFVLSWPSRRST